MPAQYQEGAEGTIHDVIIIGAGPCGLAVAARLCESTPSAIFTDAEHERYHWIRKHRGRMSVKDKKNGRVTLPRQARIGHRYSTLVLDSSGDEWMTRWNTLFRTFEIKHLRSPMFFHVDPGDRDGLLAYTHEQERDKDLLEIKECVGKEVSKHHKKKRAKCRQRQASARPEVVVDERDRKDYFNPTQRLFSEHCKCVVDRYALRKGLISEEEVRNIKYEYVEEIESTKRIFTIHTNKGYHYARSVVLAVGPGNGPRIPGLKPGERIDGACHSMQIRQFPDPSVKAKIEAKKATNVLVVGGGLTSAQIGDLAIRRGVSKVWHIMRGPLKVKPFDIDLEWMGKFKNYSQAVFWSADSDEERLTQIQTARNGGSMTPPMHATLKRHIASERLSLHTHTTLTSRTYNPTTSTWTITTTPSIPELEATPIDYIYFATGIESNISTLPFLQSMHEDYPIEVKGGLPVLNEDLMWRDGVPLFVTGRLGGLRLGPGAGNLGGARVGAERVVWEIEEVLGKGEEGGGEKGAEKGLGDEYVTGLGSRYRGLRIDVGGEEEEEGREAVGA